MSEPRFAYRNLIKMKKAGKVKAFFDLLIPTESIGTIQLAGFKVVEGSKGHFISLPNRAVKNNKKVTVTTAGGSVEGVSNEVEYVNNIRFESQDKYNEFRDVLNKEVLPAILEKIQ
jgi:hypothetical protein